MITEISTASSHITGETFRRMVMNAGASIRSNESAINDLNVFPVPDGDTGSNMSMTITSAVNDLMSSHNDSIGDVAALTASAMLRGARGNSGVILSLLFRGMSKELKGVDSCDGVTWARALCAGVDSAYKAVSSPAEGTILTVARIASERAVSASMELNNFEYVLDAAFDGAREALANTVNQNPVLKKAGVVDAGGMGWVVALNAMLEAIHSDEIEFTESFSETAESVGGANFDRFDSDEIKFAYCTEFIINRENTLDPSPLRDFLMGIGDSVVMVDDEEIIKVHVHTNEPGTVMQKALEYGSFATVKVENMRLQHSSRMTTPTPTPKKDYGVVAVSPGDGISEVFTSLGVDTIVSGGQTMNPSTEDILEAIKEVNAETVFVLPNNKNIIMAAQQAGELAKCRVKVVPTRSIPEGMAAMQGYDIDLDADGIAEAMTELASTADTMQVTYAARDSQLDGRRITAGDYLGLYGGKPIDSSDNLNRVVSTLGETAKAQDKELITVYYGADVSESDAMQVCGRFSELFGEENVTLIRGGQPIYYYIISAE